MNGRSHRSVHIIILGFMFDWNYSTMPSTQIQGRSNYLDIRTSCSGVTFELLRAYIDKSEPPVAAFCGPLEKFVRGPIPWFTVHRYSTNRLPPSPTRQNRRPCHCYLEHGCPRAGEDTWTRSHNIRLEWIRHLRPAKIMTPHAVAHSTSPPTYGITSR